MPIVERNDVHAAVPGQVAGIDVDIPVESRERVAQIVMAIAYQCSPAQCRQGRLPKRARDAWDTTWIAAGEEVSERGEAFEWLDLIVDALSPRAEIR